jgi:diguanylate cyclase (GGDEF)-like protein
MNNVPDSLTQSAIIPSLGIPTVPASAEGWMTELHALLQELEAVTAADHVLPPVFSEIIDDRLVQARLGVASSLFAALQCKNAAVAGHALRVALTCSAWATQQALPDAQRDAIEVTALLHDVGVIAAPDHILLKPGTLDEDEAVVMARCRKMSLEILRHSCASPQILEIVENVRAWYDGSQDNVPLRGCEIPLGARMIAIAEAFDAMTTDHVYRPARSQERAMAELYECSGTQFDPELVEQFGELGRRDPIAMRQETARRWLLSLDAAAVNSCWELNCNLMPPTEPMVDALFQGRLLDNMYDAVVFIDAAGRIVLWNRGAERLTGINSAGIRGQAWHPALLGLCDEHGRAVNEADCPVHTAIRCEAQSLRRLTIVGRGQLPVTVDAHAIPAVDKQGVTHGAVLLFHDASSELSLEQRCQSLHEKATQDPLTQAANRAEFDRVHEMFVAAHQQQRVPCSLMMCDLDHFKLVNDTYGHQAGDDAIKSLATLLKSSCRPGDLVARYGGEEFVVLCADCDNATAARRAEQNRNALGQLAQPKMDGRSVTVSIGVTEIQPGDTPETMLRRADRALLMAKAKGRNTVVQLGGGSGEADEIAPGAWPPASVGSKEVVEQNLFTPVPVKIAIEKLRGFVADHQARIVAIDGNQLRLEIDRKPGTGGLRRLTDRPTTLNIDVQFEEERVRRDPKEGETFLDTGTTRTKIKITITPRRTRNRRRDDVMAHVRTVLSSFRSYLMAYEDDSGASAGTLTRVKRIFSPWTGRK